MKKLYSLLFIPVILSCNQPKQADRRASTELALIKQFSDADSTYNAQINDANKADFLSSTKPKLVDFIVKNLNCKAENWEAHVYEIKPGENGIQATFLISKQEEFGDEQFVNRHSIVLESDDVTDKDIVKTLRTLQRDDKVYLSGIFEKKNFDVNDHEFFQTNDHFSVDESDQISNPAFYFTLTNLKKKEIQRP